MAKITDIQGVGDAYAKKLENAGITTVEGLLQAGATPDGRKALAEKTAISGKLILKWVNHADLYRINGIAGQYSELLEAAGVDTVVELATRKAANLRTKLVQANEAKNIANAIPSTAQVTKWIEEAKSLPRAVSY